MPRSAIEQANTTELHHKFENDNVSNFENGNRCNLLFVDSVFSHLQNESASNDEKSLYECGVLGLQIGHYPAINKIVDRNGNLYKDALWSHLKAASVQFRLREQIKATSDHNGEFDEYESLYSNTMTREDLNEVYYNLSAAQPEYMKHRSIKTLFEDLNNNFKNLSWFE